MAIKHEAELGLDPASAEIIVLRRLIGGDYAIDEVEELRLTVSRALKLFSGHLRKDVDYYPIYVDAKELTISTEPTDWSVHLGSLRIPMQTTVKRIPVIRTASELSDRGVVFETSLEDRYLVNAVPTAVHKLIDALATGEADQVYMLYPLSW